jgi:antitoxin component YwqK of YwqJK toxin-antitoxin module
MDMKKDSVWLNFAPSGRLSLSESYKNDKLDGPRIIYYLPEDLSNKSRLIQSVTNYTAGLVNGEKIEYFDNGNIRSKGTYVNNKKEGVWISNHPSGNLMILERYKNGQMHGWAYAQDDSGKETGKHYYYYGEKLEGEKLEFKMKQFKKLGINPNN